MTTANKPTEQAVTRGVSLRPVEDRALADLAIAEGHLNRSRVIQGLIRKEMVRQHGRNWERRYESAKEGVA